MSSKPVNSLAKVFDPKQGVVGKHTKHLHEAEGHVGFKLLQSRIESLSDKMDKLIHIQEKVLCRLDGMSQEIDGIEQDMETLKVDKEEIHLHQPLLQRDNKNEMKELCKEMSTIMSAVNQRTEQQERKLEGMEKLVLGIQQVISFIGETVKTSRFIEQLFKGPTFSDSGSLKVSKKHVSADECELAYMKAEKQKDSKKKTSTGLKSQKKKKPPDTPEIAALRQQVQLLAEVQQMNQINAEKLSFTTPPQSQEMDAEEEEEIRDVKNQTLDLVPEPSQVHLEMPKQEKKSVQEEPVRGKNTEHIQIVQQPEQAEAKLKEQPSSTNEVSSVDSNNREVLPPSGSSESSSISVQAREGVVTTTSVSVLVTNDEGQQSQRHLTQENLEKEMRRKSTLEEMEDEKPSHEENNTAEESEGEMDRFEEEDSDEEGPEFFIDCSPPPAAPFNHRIVSAKPNQISSFYTINRQEVLGGGRFGQVHRCIENSSGLTLAAKVIKSKTQKEKDMVKNEIQMMNQLDHANLIQLYAAYESRNDIILVLEYVDGGELFDRIIDENYKLTELDSIMFIRQICEGIQHMHKMYILHLDLKPENIMCVSRLTNKIKIIDFGLARKFDPKEKLKVNFGTPEFLAPEIVNYEHVSFPTDMWSLGVITYMLLSSLSPFLGDDNTETMNNILACKWNLEEIEFTDISKQAKDFICKLLVMNKSGRISASEALRHPWLSDPVLHYRLHEKKNMCRSRRSSCVPTINM